MMCVDDKFPLMSIFMDDFALFIDVLTPALTLKKGPETNPTKAPRIHSQCLTRKLTKNIIIQVCILIVEENNKVN